MKILEINKFNYSKGGADRHYLEVVKLLKSKGNEVAVFSMESPQNEFSPWKKYFLSHVGYGKDNTIRQKVKGIFRMFYSREARKKINKLLDDFKPEIVHIHNIYHQLSPTILFEIKKRKIPVVMTVHDYKLINPNYNLSLRGKFYDRCRNGKFYECFLDKCVKDSYIKSFLAMFEAYWHQMLGTYEKNINLYLVPSAFVKKILKENGISEEKIKIFPHFAEKENLADRTKTSKKGKRINVLYSGRISRDKGVDQLIDIFKEIPETDLYLAGQIEDGLEIPKFANIKHLGFLNQSELEKSIRESAFIVSASRLPETFGLIALEGMKMGKPFVGYDTGAYGEIVVDNHTGYLCQNKDELRERIEKLANDEGLRILFSRNALEQAKKFDAGKYYTEILDIFKTFTEKGNNNHILTPIESPYEQSS
ncbi:MAG TPA: glycosyltransferase [Patescibacteria group bacterium]